jgi:nitrite reductase (cytochrome c-552)
LLIGFTLVLVSCNIKSEDAKVSTDLKTNDTQKYFGDFKELYPDEYSSFVKGSLLIESDGTAHSHANLRNRVEEDPKLSDIGAPCLSCKTYEFNELFTAYGMDIFTMSYAEVTGKISDYFSCRTCHITGNPYDGAGATLVTYTTFAKKFLEEVDPKTAACGQCHNATCDYSRYLSKEDGVTLESFDPYRYGTDADALRKAGFEDGLILSSDSDLEIDISYRGHPDIELFQVGLHQSLGLTCVSCHMPKETNADGGMYLSHNSSGSPLENESAMRFCLTCHQDQGIDDTIEMRKFVRSKQAELGVVEGTVEVKLVELKELILQAEKDNSMDETTLSDAKTAYVDAKYYYTFQHAGADIPGGKVAHSSAAMYDYLEKSTLLLNAAIDLFRV